MNTRVMDTALRLHVHLTSPSCGGQAVGRITTLTCQVSQQDDPGITWQV